MKIVKILGARAKLQTGEGAPAATTATDAVLLAENPVMKIGYAHDGSRASSSPATMGHQPRVAPSGRTGETSLKVEPRGYGSAYSVSNLLFFQALARAAGFDAAISTGAGTEKIVLTPTPGPAGFGIASLDLYSRGQLYSLTDVYADWSIGANGPEVPMVEFAVKGLLPSITDVAVPTMTYGPAKDLLPPKAINMALTLNGVALPKPKSWSIKGGRTINPRMDQNGAGHGGWAIGARAPMFEATYENAALATLDPYTLRDAATQFAWSLAIGATQYNRHKLAGPAAQVVEVSDESEDPTATIKLSMQLNPSAFGLNDELAWTFD